MTTIYAMVDPRTGLIRYIGKTIHSLRHRRSAHIHDARSGKNGHRCKWIRSLLFSGLRPTIIEIESCSGNGFAEEIFHIRLAKKDGIKLVNDTDGGEGCLGLRHSAKTKEKLSRIGRGRPHSAEHKKNISEGLVGRMVGDSMRRKISAKHNLPDSWFQNPKPHEYLEKLSIATKRLWANREYAEKIRKSLKAIAASRKGRPVSEEQRRRLASYNVGRVQGPEARQKVSSFQKGRIKSPEHRKKIGESHSLNSGPVLDRCELVKKLSAIRVNLGKTKVEFSELIGADECQWGTTERNQYLPRLSTLKKWELNILLTTGA
jgi:hypothetical protein